MESGVQHLAPAPATQAARLIAARDILHRPGIAEELAAGAHVVRCLGEGVVAHHVPEKPAQQRGLRQVGREDEVVEVAAVEVREVLLALEDLGVEGVEGVAGGGERALGDDGVLALELATELLLRDQLLLVRGRVGGGIHG